MTTTYRCVCKCGLEYDLPTSWANTTCTYCKRTLPGQFREWTDEDTEAVIGQWRWPGEHEALVRKLYHAFRREQAEAVATAADHASLQEVFAALSESTKLAHEVLDKADVPKGILAVRIQSLFVGSISPDERAALSKMLRSRKEAKRVVEKPEDSAASPHTVRDGAMSVADQRQVGSADAGTAVRQPAGSSPANPLAEIQRNIEHAEKTVERLCNGEELWRMSIPARPDVDPDLIISRVIGDARWLLSELASVQRALAGVEEDLAVAREHSARLEIEWAERTAERDGLQGKVTAMRTAGEAMLKEKGELEQAMFNLRAPLLYYFGTTDPELLADVWEGQAKERDASAKLEAALAARTAERDALSAYVLHRESCLDCDDGQCEEGSDLHAATLHSLRTFRASRADAPVVESRETREAHPATYLSAWQCNEDGTAELMIAEDWLDEEANAYGINGEDAANPNRVQITRAIAEEIRHLRVSRAWWRTEHDHLLGKFASVQQVLAEKDRQLHEAESTKADWRGAAKDATKRADELHVELAARTAERDALRKAAQEIRALPEHVFSNGYFGLMMGDVLEILGRASRADAPQQEMRRRSLRLVAGNPASVAPAGGEATPATDQTRSPATLLRGADRMALEIHRLVERRVLDARSKAADALLDYAEDRWGKNTPFTKLAALGAGGEATPSEPRDKHAAGLYEKFRVERADGTSAAGRKHDGCEYFVLDITHDPFAVPALQAYSKACRPEYAALADDLDRIANRAAVPRRATSEHTDADKISTMTTDTRNFPIMDAPDIPWSVLVPHESQALINHHQTLQRLAERGGLTVQEALHIIEGRRWALESTDLNRLSKEDSLKRLTAHVQGRSP